jgi:tRNA(Ile)-lysidine synthase
VKAARSPSIRRATTGTERAAGSGDAGGSTRKPRIAESMHEATGPGTSDGRAVNAPSGPTLKRRVAEAPSGEPSKHGARARSLNLDAARSLLGRCHFPDAGVPVHCALSGGPDSTALVALAVAARCSVTAHHVHHGLRPSADVDARVAQQVAASMGVEFVLHRVTVTPGSNLEARARSARHAVLPAEVMTGHTADDQAETVLLRLIRGAGSRGLGAMTPGLRHPILNLRRDETQALCQALGIVTAQDPTNADPRHLRNRVRHEVLPLLNEVADRDVVPLLVRTAELLRQDSTALDDAARALDPTDALAVAAAPLALARRAIRAWLIEDGYPPDAAAVERVLEVARGTRTACEIPGGRRVERSRQRLRVHGPAR